MTSRHSISFRTKLVLVYCITLIAVVSVISVTMTSAASNQVINDKKSHLSLLTEQVLRNFTGFSNSAAQQLYTVTNSKGVSDQMYVMRKMNTNSKGYYQDAQTLVYFINQMISTQTYYDQVYIRMNSGLSFTNSFAPKEFVEDATSLMNERDQSNYGIPQWTRTQSGHVYIIRDIYNLMPFHRLGKSLARVRQDMFSSIGASDSVLDSAIAVLDKNGKMLMMFGKAISGMDHAAEAAFITEKETVNNKEEFFTNIHENDQWIAVGLLPVSTFNSISQAVVRTGVFVTLIGIISGALVMIAITQRMTRQMQMLVRTMDEITNGNLTLDVPVVSSDETGQMAAHFNRMIAQTRELLKQVILEENQKGKAEYEMLEYKYRSLQSQINPHFIYNAMETVNALAKIDGNNEICSVVQHISAFFRQNASNMQKRFIPISQEFESLKQYACIYRYIHGNTLSTPFICSPGAQEALIPTMILQPVLENALVHGVRPANDCAVVSICATDENDLTLKVTVSDNGEGMPPEIIKQILQDDGDETINSVRASAGIGLRNVRDRLRIVFGRNASIAIDSQSGKGTSVVISIPLVYDESELKQFPGW